MNRTVNQLVNALHLDPKIEAAVRKIIENAGGVNDSTPIVNEISGNELIPIKQDGENKAVSAAALVKGAKEVYVLDIDNYTAADFISLKAAIKDNKIINIKHQNIILPAIVLNVTTTLIQIVSSIIGPTAYTPGSGIVQKTKPTIGLSLYLLSDNGTYDKVEDALILINSGDGTKFLSDDGTYKEVGGGSESYVIIEIELEGDGTTLTDTEIEAIQNQNVKIKYNKTVGDISSTVTATPIVYGEVGTNTIVMLTKAPADNGGYEDLQCVVDTNTKTLLANVVGNNS